MLWKIQQAEKNLMNVSRLPRNVPNQKLKFQFLKN